MENELRQMKITLDDQSELTCNVIDIIELDSKSYIALVTPEEDQVFIYEYVEDPSSKEIDLLSITDKNIFDKVFDIFYDMISKAEEEAEKMTE